MATSPQMRSPRSSENIADQIDRLNRVLMSAIESRAEPGAKSHLSLDLPTEELDEDEYFSVLSDLSSARISGILDGEESVSGQLEVLVNSLESLSMVVEDYRSDQLRSDSLALHAEVDSAELEQLIKQLNSLRTEKTGAKLLIGGRAVHMTFKGEQVKSLETVISELKEYQQQLKSSEELVGSADLKVLEDLKSLYCAVSSTLEEKLRVLENSLEHSTCTLNCTQLALLKGELEKQVFSTKKTVPAASIGSSEEIPIFLLSPKSMASKAENLQSKLNWAQDKITETLADPTDTATFELERARNKFINLRGQQAIYDSIRTSETVTNRLKAIERGEESSRIRRCSQVARSISVKLVQASPQKPPPLSPVPLAHCPSLQEQLQTLSHMKEEIQWVFKRQLFYKRVLQSKRDSLKHREGTLLSRHQAILSGWLIEPSARNIVPAVQKTLQDITAENNALEAQKEKFYKELAEFNKKKQALHFKVKQFNGASAQLQSDQSALAQDRARLSQLHSTLSAILVSIHN